MEIKFWIWLSQLQGVGPILQKRLLSYFGDPKEIYEATVSDLTLVHGIGIKSAKSIQDYRLEKIEKVVEQLEQLGVKIITYEEQKFAEVFACSRSPILYYYFGKLPTKRGVAVIGARRCTPKGKQAAKEIASYLAQNDIPVISGLAKGIDGYAHSAALKAQGYTMAVVAGGVNICYPKEHKPLYEEIIANGGAVLSAYPPHTIPHPKNFIERNAHISAWSTDVIVVQASEKSGSLTTANFAIEQGRNLFAVPYSIYEKEAAGSNKLIQEGAKIYLGYESLPFLNRKKTPQQIYSYKPSPQEQKILDTLNTFHTCTVKELSNKVSLSEIELVTILLEMEIKTLVKMRGVNVSLY